MPPSPCATAPASAPAPAAAIAAMRGELIEWLDRLSNGHDGKHATAIAGLTINRMSAPQPPQHVIQTPAFSVIAQGHKQLSLGQAHHTYDPMHYMVSAVNLPVMACVDGATPDRPYLGLRLDLDIALLERLVHEMPLPRMDTDDPGHGLQVEQLEAPLLDAVLRLLRLLETPEDIAVLAPMVQREILYRLLSGTRGAALSRIALRDSHAGRVRAATALLRERFDQTVSMTALAREVHMSVSTLHHHFRAVTAMSPLQFQKRVRLEEARRLLLGGGLDITAIAGQVGYESPSQFSREYRRLFGDSPRADRRRWLEQGMSAGTVIR
ncbi:AraC-type DNA-binding protein [Kushneria avicenniae]|uniref:AraC-type DNA-binding protein n=1 Tax=Kushneria avicenniae TaxID=402385 RepID=A0A1I1MK05_9GAMM|nr:AraC family transcriptional regulator [Kushneria avicenniae]SFC85721.1 AraC-type DNA-binding protein [Kushneria avicenniae]